METRTYLVGGAVRDEMLGIPVAERDWVVTGATPASLIAQGFRQVGASFPVFLHPKTQEEYALARTERKAGRGYHGFNVDFHPGVTLEEDLARRDLTINAMARSSEGELIDPFGGAADLERRVLRHVSPAFSEDPLRVLRVARFAARLAHLGFTVAPETMSLMREIASSGELLHLSAERNWAELEGGLAAKTPRVFVQVLRECGALAELLPEVDALFHSAGSADQGGNPGLRTLAALDYAANRDWPVEVRFAVLVHAVGRNDHPPETTTVKALCERLRTPNAFLDLALSVHALHELCHATPHLTPAETLSLLEAADLLRRPERFDGFVHACEAIHAERAPYRPGAVLRAALTAALDVKAAQLDLRGLRGEQIGEVMRSARIAAIATTGGAGRAG